jgi:hypothetical protein
MDHSGTSSRRWRTRSINSVNTVQGSASSKDILLINRPKGTKEMEVLPHPLRSVLKTLAFIGMAKPGQKCFMEQERFIDPLLWNSPSTWLNWWIRRRSAESVASNLKKIEDAIDAGMSAFESFPTHAALIRTYLVQADQGLVALTQTYHDAPGVLASLQVLRQQIALAVGEPVEEL